jgi:glutamine---fructose-6-phosphate transaminase (isomerizing)
MDAGELLHYRQPTKELLVLTSQSGESAETRKLAEGCPPSEGYVALTNHPHSTIATRAKISLPMLAGAESAISAKTYVNSLAVLYLMGHPMRELDRALDRLEGVAKSMPVTNQTEIEAAADFLADASALQFIGRGPCLATVKQAALTYMEGTKIPAAAFTGGGFRHGAVELLATPLRSILFVASQSRTFDLMRQLAIDLAQHQSRVLILTDEVFPLPNHQARLLTVPRHGEDLFSLACATTQALLLESLARRRGYLAGVFIHGHKVTDTE